ncbi:hypothetical protein PspCFBP13508_09895 [Pseudomonas sp. CFBP13508]|nr:hypothetical protein PspCFBP13508_09895 [Pseudomonas sp. CFBP13508]
MDQWGGQSQVQSGPGDCQRRRICRHSGVDGGQAGLRLETESIPFASKLAPTLDLCRSQIPCGSELAREGGVSRAD